MLGTLILYKTISSEVSYNWFGVISIKNKIIIYRNTVIANCKNNKQFSYSIKKYGDLAIELAKLSIKYNKRFNNLIKCKKKYAILYIYNNPLNKIHAGILPTGYFKNPSANLI